MNNIYIPENLILMRVDRKEKLWDVYYSLNGYLLPLQCDYSSYYYTRRPPTEFYAYSSEILKGIVPAEAKDVVRIVPNRPFHPEIHGLDKIGDEYILPEEVYRIRFADYDRGIYFNSIDERDNNSLLLKLGVDKGRVISDAVVGFRYSSSYLHKTKVTDFFSSMILISPLDPEYEGAIKESRIIDKFYSKTAPTVKDLVPGMFYKKRGRAVDYEQGLENPGITSCIVAYLGNEWKVANGEHKKGNFNPGTNFTRVPMFIEANFLIPNGKSTRLVPGNKVKLCSLSMDQILCPLPDLEPLPDYEIEGLKKRWEASLWSHKFWNTPGVVKKFSLMTDKEFLGELGNGSVMKGGFRNNGEFIKKSIYTDSPDLFNLDKIETIKFIGDNNNSWGLSSLSSYNIRSNKFTAVSLDCSDSTRPLQVNQVIFKEGTMVKWLGDEEWIDHSKGIDEKVREMKGVPTRGCGIQYHTSDGNFIFREVLSFLTHEAKSLANTGNGTYKEWRIADPTPKELNRLATLRK